MVKPPHPCSMSRSLMTSCDTPVVFVLLVNITANLLSRRPRPLLRNRRGSRTSTNTTEFCLILYIIQDAIFILMYIHLILHWRARTARLSHYSFCSSFILSCRVLHYSVMFNPVPWIIPKKSLVQLFIIIPLLE